jgi:hypothetical protein
VTIGGISSIAQEQISYCNVTIDEVCVPHHVHDNSGNILNNTVSNKQTLSSQCFEHRIPRLKQIVRFQPHSDPRYIRQKQEQNIENKQKEQQSICEAHASGTTNTHQPSSLGTFISIRVSRALRDQGNAMHPSLSNSSPETDTTSSPSQ